ncbi:MAG: hypothetical protein RBT34_12960 [Anaerolineaceae bacterium]|jgi:hypothetical protein|nr:hypothetical protein [Anaerolineaceae bacterium]
MIILAPVTHIVPLTKVRRARLLPTNGRVLVKAGQSVTASDVVAETRLQNKHTLVDVQRDLNMTSAAETREVIDRKLGERVQEGDVIAETGRLFRRVVRAPVSGVIVMISSGQVLMEADQPPFRLKAGLDGEVTEVLPEQGVMVETNGALLQGVWGNGKISQGLLLNLTQSAGDELTPPKMDVSMRGAIGFAGWCGRPEALEIAAQLPLRGLILGSILPGLIPLAEKMDLPIMVLEGFGQIAINHIAYDLLITNVQRSIALNTAPWNRFTGSRPEAIITLPAPAESSPEIDIFKPGQTIRVQTAPYCGQTGILSNILPGLTTLDNGLRTQAAIVRLRENNEITVPLANLDVLQ